MLVIKENVDLDQELIELGFEKAREYFHYKNVSVRICNREVVISHFVKASRNPQHLRSSINPILLKMVEKGIISCKE